MVAPGRRSALALLSMLGASMAAAQTPVCMDTNDLPGMIVTGGLSGGRVHVAVDAQAGTLVLSGSFYGFKGVPSHAWVQCCSASTPVPAAVNLKVQVIGGNFSANADLLKDDVWDSGYLGAYGGDRQAATTALSNGVRDKKAYASILTTPPAGGEIVEIMGFMDVPSGTCP